MKDLESLLLETTIFKLVVFPSIRNAEVVWNSEAELKALPGVWIVNGGQSHPTRESAIYGLQEGLIQLDNGIAAARQLLSQQLDREFRKSVLSTVPNLPKTPDGSEDPTP